MSERKASPAAGGAPAAQGDLLRLARAFDFAARKHVSQKRKGAAREPYVNHLAEVALLLAQAGCDTDLVIAGVLHGLYLDADFRQRLRTLLLLLIGP